MKDSSLEQSILDVAEKLFLERGFALTTTTEIARQVGCNQALVHYYFRTKELLFQKIFEKKITLFASSFFDISSGDGSFLERLERQVGVHFDMFSKNPRLPFFIINEMTTNPARIDTLRESLGVMPRAIIQYLEENIQQAVGRNEMRPIAAIDLIITIISLNAGCFLITPLLCRALGAEAQEVIEGRRAEIITTVINSIKNRR